MASSKALIGFYLLLISVSLFVYGLRAEESFGVDVGRTRLLLRGDTDSTRSYPPGGDSKFGVSLSQEENDIDCDSACDYRCSKTSRHKMCIRACRTCCSRCNCVPPGTSGNEDVCPCYANMTTHDGRHKCP